MPRNEHGELVKAHEDIIEMLEVRFGDVPNTLGLAVFQIKDTPVLKAMLKKAATVKKMPEFADYVATLTDAPNS